MPKQKDLKRHVRERMRKTGESYTTARAHVLAKRPTRAASLATGPAPALGDMAEKAGMSDAAVAKKTGRTWAQWVSVLDSFGAQRLAHREIARHLHEVEGLPAWWTQTVTVGYERIRGLREKGQRRGGGFDVNKSKTYPVPLATLWTAAVRCKPWLGEVGVRMSKATKPKSMRWRWSDGTPIDVNFWPRGEAKSQLQLQHKSVATREEAARLRAFWSERLAKLGEVLAGASRSRPS
jgi:hypothetical protein